MARELDAGTVLARNLQAEAELLVAGDRALALAVQFEAVGRLELGLALEQGLLLFGEDVLGALERPVRARLLLADQKVLDMRDVRRS